MTPDHAGPAGPAIAAGAEPASAERSAVVIVASTSAAAGLAADTTGPAIRVWLAERGFSVAAPIIAADGQAVGEALRAVLLGRPHVVLTTGGTGVSPSDRTPEQTSPLLDVELPGLVEEFRRRGAAQTPTALLTRGVAGFAGDTFVMNLPGSRGGVRDGLAVLDPVLEHLLGQRRGLPSGGHPGAGPR